VSHHHAQRGAEHRFGGSALERAFGDVDAFSGSAAFFVAMRRTRVVNGNTVGAEWGDSALAERTSL
jgi:hypothetical protein